MVDVGLKKKIYSTQTTKFVAIFEKRIKEIKIKKQIGKSNDVKYEEYIN